MTAPDLEDRLPGLLDRLAADVHAPASLDATHAIVGRVSALRRRRRNQRVGVVGVLTTVLVAGGLWFARAEPDGRPDVATDPADDPGIDGVPPGDPGELPALTIDHPQATVVAAYDESVPGQPGQRWHPAGDDAVTRQVFRRPGDYAGPLVLVASGDAEAVRVRHDGLAVADFTSTVGPADVTVGIAEARYRPGDDGTALRVDALGLTGEELDDFVAGLRPRDDGAGQEATVLPAGLEELVVDVDPSDPLGAATASRIVDLDYGPRADQVYLHAESAPRIDPSLLEAIFLLSVWDRRTTAQDDGRLVEVLGRPALLVESGPEPELLWLHTTTVAVDLHLPPRDPEAVDELIAGIRELSPEEWADLKATVPHRP